MIQAKTEKEQLIEQLTKEYEFHKGEAKRAKMFDDIEDIEYNKGCADSFASAIALVRGILK